MQASRAETLRADLGLRLGAAQTPTAHPCRVKTALAKKEEVVNGLRKQHEVGPSGSVVALPGVGASRA